MPNISRFYGITIGMFYNDHNPPHFHAEYGGREAIIEIATGAVLRGNLPRRAMNHVLEWWALNQGELAGNWDLARAGRPLRPVAPLD